MSKQFNQDTSLEAIKIAVAQLLEQAHQEERQLQAWRQQIFDYQLEAERAFVAHVSKLWQLREDIVELVNHLEQQDFLDEETMEDMIYISEELTSAPLFHPHYEKMLQDRAGAAQQNGQTMEHDMAKRIKDRLDSFSDYPTEEEIEAGKAALQALSQLGINRPGMDIEMALQGIVLPATALLDAALEKLGQQKALALLQQQTQGLKAYLARIEKESQLLTTSDATRAALENRPPDDHHDMADLQATLDKLKAALEDTLHLRAPSPLLNELAEAFEEEDEDEEFRSRQVDAFLHDMLDESEGLFFGGGFDDEPFFPADDDDLWDEVEDPLFPLGSTVQITADFWPSKDFPELNLNGLQGRVEAAFTDGETTFYNVELDSPSMLNLPEHYIRALCEDQYGNFSDYELEEDQLKAAKAQDTEDEATATMRGLFHQYFWGDIKDNAAAVRIFDIMMRAPAADDLDNWAAYFAQEVQFPFDAQVEGLIFHNIEPGTRVEVLGIEGKDPEDSFGLIASIRKGRAILSHPLCELMPLYDEDPKAQPLADYRLWADLML